MATSAKRTGWVMQMSLSFRGGRRPNPESSHSFCGLFWIPGPRASRVSRNDKNKISLAGPIFRFRHDAFALGLLADAAVLQIAPGRRAQGRLVPGGQPIAERIAEPRRLRTQR